MDKFTEKTVSKKRVFDGRLLKVDSVDVELPDGRKSVREIVKHPGAAVVLLRGEDGRFVLVRQYRKPAEKALLEVVAGTLDGDAEDPAECAEREVAEETGFVVTKLEKLGAVFPAPGYTSEKLHMFYAEGSEGETKHRPDADENIERVFLSEAEIDGMVKAGEIEDAKTLVAWLMFKTREAK